MNHLLVEKLTELIGLYGFQVATTGEIAPTKELTDALSALSAPLQITEQQIDAAHSAWLDGYAPNLRRALLAEKSNSEHEAVQVGTVSPDLEAGGDPWQAADRAIHEAYPDMDGKGAGWWGAQRIPNFGILRGAIVREILAALSNQPPIAPQNPVWKVGSEYAPFHPSASHVRPEYRDGWNACFYAALSVLDDQNQHVHLAGGKSEQPPDAEGA